MQSNDQLSAAAVFIRSVYITNDPYPKMARNYEKRFVGLNRFLEAKQKEERKDRDVKRPHLHQLGSVEEVKKWIPSIKREINYLLQQISGAHESRNYPDHKIEEFKSRVDQLKKEHQRFVSKVRTLDPSYADIIPWEPRGYRRKRSHDSVTISHDHHMDKRLCLSADESSSGVVKRSHDCHVLSQVELGEAKGYPLNKPCDTHTKSYVKGNARTSIDTVDLDSRNSESHDCHQGNTNPLHLEYSSSSSESNASNNDD